VCSTLFFSARWNVGLVVWNGLGFVQRDLPPRHGLPRSLCAQEMYQYRSDSPEPQHHRRKSTSSMPPSDKSADSSDLDSVHSLPISPSTPRTTVDKTSTSRSVFELLANRVFPVPCE